MQWRSSSQLRCASILFAAEHAWTSSRMRSVLTSCAGLQESTLRNVAKCNLALRDLNVAFCGDLSEEFLRELKGLKRIGGREGPMRVRRCRAAHYERPPPRTFTFVMPEKKKKGKKGKGKKKKKKKK